MARLIRRQWRWILLAAATLVVVLGYQWRAAIRMNRSVPDEPFQIAGNLYYVGAAGVTSFLLTGPEGHVLIDGGYPETAPLIVASIARLGFHITDVKVLLNFDLGRKRRERATARDKVGPFIDRERYRRFIDRAEQQFRGALADQQQ